MPIRLLLSVLLLSQFGSPAQHNATVHHVLTVSGTTFQMDGQPFPYTGLSFFNAIYNPTFNRDSETRKQWLKKFHNYDINVLRVWAQWDSKRGFADSCPDCTLYYLDGRLRQNNVNRLKQIAADADSLGMVIELTLFSQESWHDGIQLSPDAADRALSALTREMLPFRNVTFQIWNEFSERTLNHLKTIKSVDPQRLVTSSPGGGGTLLASVAENRALDYLSPHTSRQTAGKPWEIAPAEINYLLKRFRKPVVDDEPARTGTRAHGGPPGATYPTDNIIHIYKMWQLGAYITYHHDMFQTGYGSSAVPPTGIPDPDFSPYHKAVFEFIRLRDRYAPEWYGKR